MRPLVSIITPCYNGAKYLPRFLDSVLTQTYSNIEVIIVNDGSVDDTEQIALSYEDALNNKGYSFKYIRQENSGPAAAINAGLKIFKGDYLTWVDCDDWMTPDCIEEKVELLESNSNLGLVVCKIAVVLEDDIDKTISVLKIKDSSNGNFFARLLSEDIYIAPPVGWMIKSSMFSSVNPDKTIFDGNKSGQNWQMLLPISYHFEGGYIDKVLGYYLVRTSSISHSGNAKALIKKSYEYETNCKEALKSLYLDSSEEKYYLDLIVERYTRSRLRIASKNKLTQDAITEYGMLKCIGRCKPRDRLNFIRCRYQIFDVCFRIAELPLRIMRKIKRMIAKR